MTDRYAWYERFLELESEAKAQGDLTLAKLMDHVGRAVLHQREEEAWMALAVIPRRNQHERR